MKRRLFLKAIASLPFLGFLAKNSLSDDAYLTDPDNWYIKRPTTGDAATKYISEHFGEVVRHVTHDAALHGAPIAFGLASVKAEGTKVACDTNGKYDTYLLKGDGETPSEAWHNFWMEVDVKVPLFSQKDKKIFWRRSVIESSDRDFAEIKTDYRVACRFSTTSI